MAKKDFLVSLDLNKNELLNAVIQNLGAHPSTPAEGQIYYNTTDDTVYCYANGTWLDLGIQGGAGATNLGYTASATNGIVTSDTGNDSTIPLVTASTGTNLAGLMSPTDKTILDDSVKIGTPIAAASTTTIGTLGSGEVIHITGATTITSFGLSTTGTRRTLIFDSNPTITHNGTSLLCPGGVNITTGAGVSIDVVCENGASGYWKVLNISRTETIGANPSTQVGLSTVNGTATTFMRSDAAPALNVGITPTWTAAHTWSALGTFNLGLNVLGATVNLNASSNFPVNIGTGTSTGIVTIGNLSNEINLPKLTASKAVFTDASKNLTSTGTLGIDQGGTGTTVGSITGSGALTFTAGGTNTNINLVPNGNGTVDVASKRITSVATPTSGTDAVNKNYVDAIKQSLDIKDSVKVATTGAETYTISAGAVTQISGTSIDGVSLSINDRILIKNAPATTGAGAGAGTANTTQPANGIYIVTNNTTNLTITRDVDADSNADVTTGLYVFVSEGTSNADTGFVLTTNDSITLNTTALTFTQFSGAGQISAGNGMTKTGNTLDIASHAGTAGSVGTIVVTADSIGVSLGSTSTTAAAGNHNHDGAYTKKYTTTIGNTSLTSLAVSHNLGTRAVISQVYDSSTYAVIDCQIVNTDINTTTFSFNTAPGTNAYTVIIIG